MNPMNQSKGRMDRFRQTALDSFKTHRLFWMFTILLWTPGIHPHHQPAQFHVVPVRFQLLLWGE